MQTFAAHEWDLSGKISGPAELKLRFQYTSGAHRLGVEWAEIAVDGAVIARDAHAAMTGGTDKNNLFLFKIPTIKPGAKITLPASVRSDAGTDSNGEMQWEK